MCNVGVTYPRLEELVAGPKAALAVRVISNPLHGSWAAGGGETLSFSALHAAAQEVAAALLRCSPQPAFVGVCCEGTLALPVALLAVLQARQTFVPLPDLPSTTVVGNTLDLACVLVAGANRPAGTGVPIGPVALGLYLVVNDVQVPRGWLKAAESDAYALQTSGSTGPAKIVVVPHAAIVQNVRGMMAAGLQVATIAAVISPFTFDPAIADLFMTWAAGACALLVDNALRRQPLQMTRVLLEHKVDYMCVTPSFWQRLGLPQQQALVGSGGLRVLLLGGEPFPSPASVLSWWAASSATQVYNIYGITEVSCWALLRQVLREALEIGIPPDLGDPLPGVCSQTDAGGQLLLGRSSTPCCLVWHATQRCLTARPLVPTGDLVTAGLEAGQLQFRCRLGSEIKRDGHIVDVTSVEERITRTFGVICYMLAVPPQQSCSVARVTLVAVLVIRAGDGLDRAAWLARIRAVVPGPAAPDEAQLIPASHIPLTGHGKIDRHALALVVQNRNNVAELQRASGVSMSHLCWQVLSAAGLVVPPPDAWHACSFFDCGGDSQVGLHVSEQLVAVLCHMELGFVMDTLFRAPSLLVAVQTLETAAQHCDNANVVEPPRKMPAIVGPLTPVQENLLMYWRPCHVTGRGGAARKSNECLHLGPSLAMVTHTAYSLRLQWRQELGKCIDATALVVQWLNQTSPTIYIGSHARRFAAFTAGSGHRLWEVALPDRIESSAVLSRCGKFVIVGCFDHSLYILEAATGALHWRCAAARAEIKSTPQVDSTSGHVCYTAHDGGVRWLDIEDRRVLWQWSSSELDTTKPTSGFFASPVLDVERGLVYVATLSGSVAALHLGDDEVIAAAGLFRCAWVHNFHSPIFSTPALAGSHLVCGCVDNTMHHLQLTNGNIPQRDWSFRAGGPIFCSPTLLPHKKTVMFGAHDGHVYCLALAGGQLLWRTSVGGQVFASVFPPTAWANVLACTSHAGRIVLLSPESGHILATYTLPAQVYSSPVIVSVGQTSLLVVGCRDDHLYGLALASRKDERVT